MEREQPKQKPRQRLKELRERFFPSGPERGDPRGKNFVMVNGGHHGDDIDQLVQWGAAIDFILERSPSDKKVLLYVEAGDISRAASRRIETLVDSGMSLSDAEVEIGYDALDKRLRGPKSQADEMKTAIRREIRMARQTNPYAMEVTRRIDDLLAAHPGKFVVSIEGQPDDVIAGNEKFRQEIEAPTPTDQRVGRIVSDRREQLADWAATQQKREANIVNQITNGLARVDVGMGVGLQGAWHHGGVDGHLREELGLDYSIDLPVSVFVESEIPLQLQGPIDYPVPPQFDLMRRIIDGERISDLEIQFALEAEAIDFTRTTPEEAALRDAAPNVDQFIVDDLSDTTIMRGILTGGVHPIGRDAATYRNQQQYVRLKLSLHEPTEPLDIIKEQEHPGKDVSPLGKKDDEVHARAFSGSMEDYAALPESTRIVIEALVQGDELKVSTLKDDAARRELYDRAQEMMNDAKAQKEALRQQGVSEDQLPKGHRMRVVFQRRESQKMENEEDPEPRLGEHSEQSIGEQEALHEQTTQPQQRHSKTK